MKEMLKKFIGIFGIREAPPQISHEEMYIEYGQVPAMSSSNEAPRRADAPRPNFDPNAIFDSEAKGPSPLLEPDDYTELTGGTQPA